MVAYNRIYFPIFARVRMPGGAEHRVELPAATRVGEFWDGVMELLPEYPAPAASGNALLNENIRRLQAHASLIGRNGTPASCTWRRESESEAQR